MLVFKFYKNYYVQLYRITTFTYQIQIKKFIFNMEFGHVTFGNK